MLTYVFCGPPFICALNEKNIAKIKFLYLQLGQYCRLISFLDVYSTPFQFVLSSFIHLSCLTSGKKKNPTHLFDRAGKLFSCIGFLYSINLLNNFPSDNAELLYKDCCVDFFPLQ